MGGHSGRGGVGGAGSPGRGVACDGAAGRGPPLAPTIPATLHLEPRGRVGARGAEGQPGPGGRKKFLWHIRWAGVGDGPHIPPHVFPGPVPRAVAGGNQPLFVCPSVGAAPMGAPGTGLCGDVEGHGGGTRVRPVMPRHPWNAGARPCPGLGWRRGTVPSGARPQLGANAQGDPCGPDVSPHRGSPIPAAPASASPRGETRGETRREPGSGQGNPSTHPSAEPGRGPVTGRFGRLPARCHRPAEPGCGGPGWRPRGCSLPRAGLTAPPGPFHALGGTRAARSGWGSWKSGSGPSPAP